MYYNAFISYKHAALDTHIAAEVQKQLENFKIPKSIQTELGVKRIERIFRDKEELTLTSDLNETIEEALNSSDYLIVICSHSTKQSIWVLKEIEFFLKTHSRKQILTVVAEGEPCDVVPEILQYEEMELLTEDGDVEAVQVPIEPLSCDYRGNIAKARREELPRLAAALLGCRYDDLRQRQRQHRRRRNSSIISAVGALLTCLVIYFAWSAARIQANYEQSLINQSNYLASESEKQLESGDRLTAALLALEALPSDDFDRPVTAKAVNALGQAIYAYQPPGINTMTLSHAFNHPGPVSMYEVHEETGTMAVVHSTYDLIVWDIESSIELLNTSYERPINKLSFSSNGTLFVLSDKIYCYEPETLQLRWSYQHDNYVTAGYYITFSPDNTCVFAQFAGKVLMLDIQTGQLLKTFHLPEEDWELGYLYKIAVSPDGQHIASTVDYGRVVVWDIKTGIATVSAESLGWTESLMFIDNERIVVTASPQDLDTSLTFVATDNTEYRILYPGVLLVNCVDLNCTTLWQNQIDYPQQYYGVSMDLHDHTDADGVVTPAVIISVGNICQIMSVDNGKTLDTIEYPSTAIAMFSNSNGVECILTSGQVATFTYQNRVLITSQPYIDNLKLAYNGNYVLVTQYDSNRILYYKSGMYDENWNVFSGTDASERAKDVLVQSGDWILVCDTSTDELQCLSVSENRLIWKHTLESSSSYINIKYSALHPDGKTAVVWLGDKELQLFDLASGEHSAVELKTEFVINSLGIYNDVLYCMSSSYDYDESSNLLAISDIHSIDMNSGAIEHVASVMTESRTRDFFVLPDNSIVFCGLTDFVTLYTNDQVYRIDGIEAPSVTVFSDDGARAALISSHDILICDAQLQVLRRIPLNGIHPLSMYFKDDQLLVACSNDKLYRYSFSDGQLLSTIDIYSDSSITNGVVWDFSKDGLLALLIDNELNLIYTDSWELYAHVAFCAGFSTQTNTALVQGFESGSSDYILGSYRIYTPEELIEKAQLMLQGIELTDEQESAYGISD